MRLSFVVVALIVSVVLPSHVEGQSRSVASLFFQNLVSSISQDNVSTEIGMQLNATAPLSSSSSDIPVVVVRQDSDYGLSVYFSAPVYKYGVNDIASAVVAVNATVGSCFSGYHLSSVSVVEEEISSSGSESPYTEDVGMQKAGYALLAVSVFCVVCTFALLHGRTLDDY